VKVDSEDSKNRTNDDRRILQVLKAIANPSHPYSKVRAYRSICACNSGILLSYYY
jgi:hypothetical protein